MYFIHPIITTYLNFKGLTTNVWYFIYAGSDQKNKVYTIGVSSSNLKNFQTVTPVTGLTTDGNEQLDNRLVIYFGGSKGVPYGTSILFNGYMTSPIFYINYYTSSNPEYLSFGEASRFFSSIYIEHCLFIKRKTAILI